MSGGTRGWLVAIAVVAATAGCGGKQAPPPAGVETGPPPARWSQVEEPDVLDRVIAVVNNDAITLSELQENVIYYRTENRQDTVKEEDLTKRLLGKLIEGRL